LSGFFFSAMCGITGFLAFTEIGKKQLSHINAAVDAMKLRGPDGNGVFVHERVALGHARLSIIDVSNAAAQPFFDPSNRYVMVFNGEIFNFQKHRDELENQGVVFTSTSDTEVLLHLFIREGENCLNKLNGFFAFAVYDILEDSLFLARDRYGEKPLLIAQYSDGIAFASEMKSLLAFDIPKDVDDISARIYSHLNYIPGPSSIFKSTKKLQPGTWIRYSADGIEEGVYYDIQKVAKTQNSTISYDAAQKELVRLMDKAVERRMISDVPLGAFLSGGIDSSVVVALASKYTEGLHTYSIGYVDEPLFDETKYAKLVADQYKTQHTVFALKNQDLFEHLHQVLDSIDEPFADSSALAVYILCKETRKHVTVALSGDGADELFGGYRKHQAEWRMRKGGPAAAMVQAFGPLWKALPASRNSKMGDLVRKLRKFSNGSSMSQQERYWNWCGYGDESYLNSLWTSDYDIHEWNSRKSALISSVDASKDMNNMMLNDMQLVLPGDMLTKVDLMSMANSLEVRPPFLDVEVVDFALSLPADYKVNGIGRKRIVQDAFRDMLPTELYNRPKHGFEVPLLSWFRNDLNAWIFDDLLSSKHLKEQGLFEIKAINQLKMQLHSSSPGDATARIWALIVFQSWWRKWMK
jgi:asparagine synthase (glutamine-hydrolysing)